MFLLAHYLEYRKLFILIWKIKRNYVEKILRNEILCDFAPNKYILSSHIHKICEKRPSQANVSICHIKRRKRSFP